jgi:hypothetical protein
MGSIYLWNGRLSRKIYAHSHRMGCAKEAEVLVRAYYPPALPFSIIPWQAVLNKRTVVVMDWAGHEQRSIDTMDVRAGPGQLVQDATVTLLCREQLKRYIKATHHRKCLNVPRGHTSCSFPCPWP